MEMVHHKNLTDKIRTEVWKRDNGICQHCKKKLVSVNKYDPNHDVETKLSELNKIPVYKWTHSCWKCKKETPIVSYHIQVGYNYIIGDIEKLDLELMKLYPWVKRTFSKTMGREVVANTCVECQAIQGNWFVMEELIEFEAIGSLENQKDTFLSIHLNRKDLKFDEPIEEMFVRLREGHIHHLDKDPTNNDLSNLILLCSSCHRKVHLKK